MKPIDLSWGQSVAVRQALVETLPESAFIFSSTELKEMAYTEHFGDPELIEITKKVIKRQIGLDYNYVLLTNGATGAVTISLRMYKEMGRESALIPEPPHYALYPLMVGASGLTGYTTNCPFDDEEKDKVLDYNHPVILVDSPSNPMGEVVSTTYERPLGIPLIWDSVYCNRVYTSGNIMPFDHNIVCGSYSKLLGLNGIRVGWIATNNPILYERLKYLVEAEYAGLDRPSMRILLGLLKQFKDDGYWNDFESNARNKLDYNREEWSKLERFFEAEVNPIGMFFYSKMDKSCQKLFEKSGIVWTKGSSMGTDDSYGRFNLGQDCKLIRQAVKTVFKNDKR